MVLRDDQKSYTDNEGARLFSVLAQSLQQPFMTIARTAELLSNQPDSALAENIQHTADSAVALLDHYLLGIRLQQADSEMFLVPVSLAASLSDVAHQLEHAAKRYDCDVELHLAGKYGPIMAHGGGLTAALLDVGTAFLESQGQRTHTKRPVIKLAAHRTRHGIVAGAFTDIDGLSVDMFRRAKTLYGQSNAPISQLTAMPGAGLFVADSLLRSMSGGLRVAHHQRMTGLAATFAPSQQLSLV